jgi:hypothetical protein
MDAIRLEDLPLHEQKYYGPEGKAEFFSYYQALRRDRTHYTKQQVRLWPSWRGRLGLC